MTPLTPLAITLLIAVSPRAAVSLSPQTGEGAAPSAATRTERPDDTFTPPADSPEAIEGGVFTRFHHPDGAVAREGYLVDGVRTGVWKSWYENGQRESHGAFEGYRRVGPWISYSPDGKTRTVGNYDENGVRHGVWRILQGPQSKVRMRVEWNHGRRDGLYERFTPAGKTTMRIGYSNGRLHGPNEKWSKGAKNKTEEGQHENGKRVGRWRFWEQDGSPRVEGTFVDGLQDGEWIEYHPNGQRKSIGRWERGGQVGEWRGFHKQGERRYVGTYVAGRLEGEFVEWWPSGDKKAEGSYTKGLFEGPWTFWNKDGRVDESRTGNYRNGDLVR